MPIAIRNDAEHDVVRLTVSGLANRDAFAAALERLRTEPGISAQPRLLWDLTDARLDVSAADVAELIELLAPRQREAGARDAVVAVIAPGDLSFGIGRMSEGMWGAGNNPGSYLVFRTMDEAQAWVGAGR